MDHQLEQIQTLPLNQLGESIHAFVDTLSGHPDRLKAFIAVQLLGQAVLEKLQSFDVQGFLSDLKVEKEQFIHSLEAETERWRMQQEANREIAEVVCLKTEEPNFQSLADQISLLLDQEDRLLRSVLQRRETTSFESLLS